MTVSALLSSPSVRVTLVMIALFGLNGVAMPFIPKFLEDLRGLNGFQVAAVMSSFQVLRIVVGLPMAAWADGFSDRRTPMRLMALGCVLAFVALLFVRGFPALLAAGFLALALYTSISPLIEAAALRAARDGGLAFGLSRGLGSFSYVFANIAGGALVSRFTALAAPALCLFGAIGVLAATAALKPSPAPKDAPARGFRQRLIAALALCRRPRFALALTATGLIQASHGFYYGLSTLAWTRQGIDPGTIGWLWGVAVLFEVCLLASLRYLERLGAPEAFVLIGGAGAVLRWTSLAFAPPLALLWPLQMLHAATFTCTHIGALRIVERETPPELAGSGMTLYAMLAAGTPLGLATLASGALFDRYGASGYLAMSGVAGLGLVAALAMLSMRRLRRPAVVQPPPSEG
jgi:PPP family 3-phenylpropionic acid transporter